MTLKNKATLLAALIGAGLIVLGTAWKERTKVDPTDYLTFERTVYSGQTFAKNTPITRTSKRLSRE